MEPDSVGSRIGRYTVDASFVAAHARRDRCKLTLIWEIRVAARVRERAVEVDSSWQRFAPAYAQLYREII